MGDFLNHKLTHIRQSELLQEAQQHRLALQALGDDAESNAESVDQQPFFAPALARLGEVMVNVGTHLQTHYGKLCQPDTDGLQVEAMRS